MKNVLITLCLMALTTVPCPASVTNEEQASKYAAEGLELTPGTEGIDLVWAKPGIDITRYQRFYLVEPLVAFRKNWQKDQNRGHPSLRVKASDMEDIKNDMAELLTEIFTAELIGAGYEFSEVRAEDVMVIKPAILDLDINAPDIQSSSTSDIFVDDAGSMKLYLEIYDSVSEQVLVKVLDQTSDTDRGHMQSQKKVANRAAATRMMIPWARALARGFDLQPE